MRTYKIKNNYSITKIHDIYRRSFEPVEGSSVWGVTFPLLTYPSPFILYTFTFTTTLMSVCTDS